MTNLLRRHPEVWYRFYDFRYAAPLDEFERPIGSGRAAIQVAEYPVLKKTKKGVWLLLPSGDRRFVRSDANKKFAASSYKEALESFLARKRRQQKILQARLKHIDEVLNLVRRNEHGSDSR